MDTEMNEEDNQGDPVDSYPLVFGPLLVHSETVFQLAAKYQTAQRATHEEEAEVVPDNSDKDENPDDRDNNSTRSSSSSYGKQDYRDNSDNSDDSRSSSLGGRRGHRHVVRPSRSVTDIEVAGSREEAAQDTSRNVNNSNGRNSNDGDNMSVDGKNTEEEMIDRIGKTASWMVEFGVAGIDWVNIYSLLAPVWAQLVDTYSARRIL